LHLVSTKNRKHEERRVPSPAADEGKGGAEIRTARGTGRERGGLLRAARAGVVPYDDGMKSKRYRVTVKAVDEAATETIVGSVMVEAMDRDAASRIALQKLWTPELEKSGARPATHAERVAGEGG
jgi:hypothetical protein